MHNYMNWKWSKAEEKKVYIGWGDINVFYNDQRRTHHDILKISIIHFLNTLVPGTILATADTSVNKQEEPCSQAVSFLLCGTALNNTHFESILLGSKAQEESEYLVCIGHKTGYHWRTFSSRVIWLLWSKYCGYRVMNRLNRGKASRTR